MRQKLFALVMVLLFAVFTSGGCGSSNNSLADTQQTSRTVSSYLAASEMASVMNSPEFAAMWAELDEEGVFEQIGDWYLMYNVSQEIQDKILGELSGDRRDRMARSFFSADLVNEKYNAGEVVVIAYPDEAIINKVLEAAGEEPNYIMNESDKNGRLEIYAIAKKTTYGRDVLSSYTIPCAVNFDDTETLHEDPGPVAGLVDSDDVDSGDNTSEPEQTVTPRIMSNEDFQVDRWRRFFLWCAALDDESIEASAYVDTQEFRASAAEISDALIRNSVRIQMETISLSYCDFNGERNNWFNNNSAFEIIYNRTVELYYFVYAAHSASDNCDYYMINCQVSTTPNGFINDYVDYNGLEFQWLSGYTRSMSLIHYISSAGDGGKTGSEVEVVAALPRLSEGEHLASGRYQMSYTVPGPVYRKGRYYTVQSDSFTYHADLLVWDPPTSTSYANETTIDYYMTRDGDDEKYSDIPSTIGWRVTMNWPFWSSTTMFTTTDQRRNLKARPDSRSEFVYLTEWVWKVSSSYRNKGEYKFLNIDARFEDGVSRSYMVRGNGDWDWYNNSKAKSFNRYFTLTQPPLN